MVHQVEACGVGIRDSDKMVARMVVLPFAAVRRAAIEVHRERPDRLGENSHTSPDRRKVQSALLGDVRLLDGIGNRIGRDGLIHRSLELRRGQVAPLVPMPKCKSLHYRLLLFETNIAERFETSRIHCPFKMKNRLN